jgi:signal recognition particle subunit SRP68
MDLVIIVLLLFIKTGQAFHVVVENHFTVCLQPLAERLDEYAEDKSLTGKKPFVATFPPDFEPIPCRPLFFDLALNHLDLPPLDDKLETAQKKAAAGGGLSGFVKGWLWGGGEKK